MIFFKICAARLRVLFVFQIAKCFSMSSLYAQTVHVLMPVYNSDPYLSLSIKSVLDQSYSSTKLLAYNDGSTDKSEQILSNYKIAEKDKVYVYGDQENRGISFARKELLKISQSIDSDAMVLWLDSDDQYIDKDFIGRFAAQMKKTNADICLFNFEIVYEDQKQIENSSGLIKEQENSSAILKAITKTPKQEISPNDLKNILDFTSLGWTKGYGKLHWPVPEDCPYEDFVYMAAILNSEKITALPPSYKPIRYLRRSTSITGKRTPATFDAVIKQLRTFIDSVDSEKRKEFHKEILSFLTRKIGQYETLLRGIVESKNNSEITPEVLEIYLENASKLIHSFKE